MYNIGELKIIVFEPNELDFLIKIYSNNLINFFNYIKQLYHTIQPQNIYYTNKYYIITYLENIFDKKINDFVIEQIIVSPINFNLIVDAKIYLSSSFINNNLNNQTNSDVGIESVEIENSTIDFDSNLCECDEDDCENILTEYDLVLDDLNNIKL